MTGIACTRSEFDRLNELIHTKLGADFKGYKADKWADVDTVPRHQRTGELFLQIKGGERNRLIRKLLTSERIITMFPGDPAWFPKAMIE